MMHRRLFLATASSSLLSSTGWAGDGIKPTFSTISTVDAAVLETVLKKLLEDRESPLEHFGNGPKVLRFSSTSVEGAFSAEDVAARLDAKGATGLTGAEFKRVKEAAAAVEARSKEKDAFRGFQPIDKRIVLYGKDEEKQSQRDGRLRPRGPQVFRAHAPGYSQDGTLALVNVWFTWSIHAGQGYLVLVKRGDSWIVLRRKFIYYV